MIKLIAFDLDGTIGETVPMCIRAFEKAVSPLRGPYAERTGNYADLRPE